MPFTIRPATVADAAALTEVYLSSFHADAIGVLVFKDTAATRKFWTDSVLEEIADPHSHFLCAIDTDSAGTELQIAGYAKWNTPAAPHPDPNDLPQWPEGGDHELANHFFGTLFRKHEEIMGDRKHWYLEIIAVAKEYQGKGAGGMLVKWGGEFIEFSLVQFILTSIITFSELRHRRHL